ncbi:[acyl-carrier-protein] S-malonyltransferase [Weissella beninensis]|uniref:Malonyl CoA-acyl carrier protein transacylase n=1 Tax=Periweissella beninensis TaxID=504936 RepID=A0ABT0VFM5_9LACO|nr:ACP S-malonyltransferase [Periweissella beninensis]MBM7543519.1 [acyl-carrier-protein] S-malonyltransferase [Periweissella beninensis]MCM2436501.1 ACP S-malonyltransferase [Periweissella beninensis]
MQTGVLFGGQGGQNINMVQHLYQTLSEYRQVIDQASQILGYDMQLKMIDEQALQTTKYTQPIVVAHSYGLYKSAQKFIPTPMMGLGLSLGEYTALIAAESIDFETGLKIVAKRGKLMQEAVATTKGAMAALIADDLRPINHKLRELQAQGLSIYPANYNSSQQLVIGGVPSDLEQAILILEELKLCRVVKLNVAGAFHTPLLVSAQTEFNNYLKKVVFKEPKFTVYSNTTQQPFKANTLTDTLVKQLISPTFFAQALEDSVNTQDINQLIEFGPDSTLTKFARKTVAKDIKRYSIFNQSSFAKVQGEFTNGN